MTVKELFEILKTEPNQERIIVLSTDAEGNDFKRLDDIEAGRFTRGVIINYDEDYGQPCLVFFPE